MKTVCVVGAGPSGLVAAKTLLHHPGSGPGSESFSVTVFDPQPRIGGLWPGSKDDGAGLLHPLMIANQSRHTVQFSDLAWEADAPQLPRAWQVGRYLERYMQRYCSFVEGEGRFRLRLGWRVEKAAPVDAKAGRKWLVQAKSEDGVEDAEQFDYLLVASGYFGQPAVPSLLGLSQGSKIPIVHSSRYRDLETLLPKAGDGKGGKILIVGGQMSGVEITGTIASHLSSAVNSAGPKKRPGADKYSIHHLIQRPTWVFPLFTSPAPSAAAPFLPLDLPSYNLNNRPRPFVNTQGHITVDAAKLINSIFQGVLGTDQSKVSPILTHQGEILSAPPYLTVSDWYVDFVRSGLITLSQGKLESVSGNTATISPSNETISDIAAIVLATGFDAAPSISYLPRDILETLSLDATNLDNAVLLAFHGTHHPKIPNLGFVGFYRSPYWGVMEMQARFLAELWSQSQTGKLRPAMQQALDGDTSIERFAALRKDPRVSQFPMGDYAFLIQEFSKALEMEMLPPAGDTPVLPHNQKPLDILTPARYITKGATDEQKIEARTSLEQTHKTAVAGLTKGMFVARAVFRSLLGEWSLERDLVSRVASLPSGHWSGTARFLLRESTKDGLKCTDSSSNNFRDTDDRGIGQEYLYIEDGNFTASDGLTFRATRRYIWRYDERRDVLSVWFVRTGDRWSRDDPRRTDDQKMADYLFHEIEFIVPETPESPEETPGWKARAGHLCVEDFYDVKYNFAFNAVNLEEWRIGYAVKGPHKDYTIDGIYTRKV